MNKLMMMAMVAAMGVAGPALADTTIGYSGQLRDANGGALPESQRNPTITFRLYKEASGGSALWGVSKKVVLNSEGLFSTSLSDSDAKKDENAKQLQQVLEENATLYIGLAPNDEKNEIKPRQQILETPRAATATVATKAATGSDGFTVSGAATITTLNVTTAKVDTVMQKTGTGEYYDLLPRGTIVMWNGDMGKVPAGWALCDGKEYTAPDGTKVTTPDMLGRFPVCIGKSTDGDQTYKYKEQGGAQSVKLEGQHMPAHTHSFKAWWKNDDDSKNNHIVTNPIKDLKPEELCGNANHPINQDKFAKYNTDPAGGNTAHENRPPYFALAFIMKL